MSLIGLLIALVVFCLIIWAARAIISAFGIGDPIATLLYVAIVIFALLILLSQLGYIGTHLRL